MMELVVIVCMLAEPEKCEQIYLVSDAPGTNLVGCMLDGQKQASEWAETHPGWFVKRWSCGAPRT